LNTLKTGLKIYQRIDYKRGVGSPAQVVEPKLIEARLRRGAEPQRQRAGVALSHPWRDFDYSERSIAAREKRGELCRLRK
jgi:hypothetical protein